MYILPISQLLIIAVLAGMTACTNCAEIEGGMDSTLEGTIVPISVGESGGITSATWVSRDKELLVGSDSGLYLLSPEHGGVLWVKSGGATLVAAGIGGEYAATSHHSPHSIEDSLVRLWHVPTRSLLAQFTIKGIVSSLGLLGERDKIISCTSTQCIVVSVESRERLVLDWPHTQLMSVEGRPNQAYVLRQSASGRFRYDVLELESMRHIGFLVADRGVTQSAISTDEKLAIIASYPSYQFIIGANSDGTTAVIDLQSGRQRYCLQSKVDMGSPSIPRVALRGGKLFIAGRHGVSLRHQDSGASIGMIKCNARDSEAFTVSGDGSKIFFGGPARTGAIIHLK